jgi:hypothetical protein
MTGTELAGSFFAFDLNLAWASHSTLRYFFLPIDQPFFRVSLVIAAQLK